MDENQTNKTARVFIAVDIAPESAALIGTLQEGLKKRVPGVRWVNPKSIHLTLKFLGEARLEKLEMLREILSSLCEPLPAFTLTVGEMGAFPNLKRPRIVWLGLEGDLDCLETLQEAVERGCEEAGFAEEKRRFSPHLTIGRVRSRSKGSTGIEEAIKAVALPNFQPFDVTAVHLYRSELTPKGAIYTKLKTFLLKGREWGGIK